MCEADTLAHMRTTIDLDDDLLREAKAAAAADGRTLKSLVEESLRARLAQASGADDLVALPVHTPSAGGLRAGVDLGDNVSLRRLLDGE